MKVVAKASLMTCVALFGFAQPPQQTAVWQEPKLGLSMTLPTGFQLVQLPSLSTPKASDPSRFLMAARMGTQNYGIVGIISTVDPSRKPYASVEGFMRAIVATNNGMGMHIEHQQMHQLSSNLQTEELLYTMPADGAVEYDAAAVLLWKGSLLSFKINAATASSRAEMLHAVETLRAAN